MFLISPNMAPAVKEMPYPRDPAQEVPYPRDPALKMPYPRDPALDSPLQLINDNIHHEVVQDYPQLPTPQSFAGRDIRLVFQIYSSSQKCWIHRCCVCLFTVILSLERRDISK